MSPRRALVAHVPSDDRTIPKKFGPELEPNYYCRGRNMKRQKYCRWPAGKGTDHVGVGRCKFHGGTNQNADREKTGRNSKIVRAGVMKLIEQHEADTSSVREKMLRTLNHTLALRDTALARYAETPTDELLHAIVGFNDTISKSGFRLEQIRAHGTVSIDRIKAFLERLSLAVDTCVKDDAMRMELRKQINAIRI